MTHPTPTPDQLTRVLSALARIKAGDGGAPGLGPTEIDILQDFIRDPCDKAMPEHCVFTRIALAHLLDVCMGVQHWHWEQDYTTRIRMVGPLRKKSGEVFYRIEKYWGESGRGSIGTAPTHLSAACAVVCAIAGVMGEKEGATDE